jgi:hypothetical protein
MRNEVTNEEILEALYTASSKAAAARQLGISRSWLYERLKDPQISGPYEAWRLEAMSDASDSLHGQAPGAVTVLAEIAYDPQVPASVRVQAANAILNHHFRVREIEEVEARLAEIEEQLA